MIYGSRMRCTYLECPVIQASKVIKKLPVTVWRSEPKKVVGLVVGKTNKSKGKDSLLSISGK